MGIKISVDTAVALSDNILIDNDVLLQNVKKSTVLGLPAHTEAQGLYSALQGEMKQYDGIIKRDAETIKDISWALQGVDEEAAGDINKAIGE
ncbi:MAG: hypothetical protein E7257_04915 [Lachnospiraceae bacterium]|nr:hypothetical protein [Lachnospiraceae bacterium]